jgi:hypothetical protein
MWTSNEKERSIRFLFMAGKRENEGTVTLFASSILFLSGEKPEEKLSLL